MVFATSVVRDAPDRADVLRAVRERTGLSLRVLPGEVEARLTFLGARRRMGWRSGPLTVSDIGGGSLEVALGRGRVPDFAVSLPLGANRLTHEFLRSADPPRASETTALRRTARHQLRDASARIPGSTRRPPSPPHVRSSSRHGCAGPRRGAAARSPNASFADGTCAARSTGWPRCPPPGGPTCPASRRPGPGRAWPERSSVTP